MSKLLALISLSILFTSSVTPAQARCYGWKVSGTGTAYPPITFKKLPASPTEYVSMTQELAKTSQGGAAALLLAMLVYTQDEKLGTQLITIAIAPSQRSKSCRGPSYRGYCPRTADLQRLKLRISGKNGHKIRAFFKGAEPENGYQLRKPYTVRFHNNRYSPGPGGKTFKVFAFTCGADRTRPITMVSTPHGWKAKEWSSVTLGVRRPAPRRGAGGDF